MEYGSIKRELRIDAAPEAVYEAISSPEHMREWWSDAAEFDPVPGATGAITFGDPAAPDATIEQLLVLEADPPRRFAFRWAYEEGPATETNSFLVTFDLIPSGDGTLLRFAETGFRERGWEAAVAKETYLDHARGWDVFLPRLATHANSLLARP
jgi:uncharacterized protein YndB with AHSA1/START domain